jgi:hypothetical protein
MGRDAFGVGCTFEDFASSTGGVSSHGDSRGVGRNGMGVDELLAQKW